MKAFIGVLVILPALAFVASGLDGLYLNYQHTPDPDLRAAGVLRKRNL